MIQGDHNTKFYHVSTLIRRKRNQILALKNAVGNWIHEEGKIKEFIRCGFDRVFLSSLSYVLRVDPLFPSGNPGSWIQRKRISVGGLLKWRLRLPFGL